MTITYNNWLEEYNPIPAYEESIIFQVNDPRVATADPHCVWTLLDDDYIIPGRLFVNRLGYIITQKHWTDPDIEVLP